MKIKRYGENAVKEALKNGYYITYFEFFTNNSGYKITDENNNILGFITFDLFCKLLRNNIIKTYENSFCKTVYGLKYN